MDPTFYSFGPFRLYPSEQLLLREQKPIPLAPKTFEVLLALVASQGHLMTRDALMHAVWPDSFVEEINLTVNISLLRKALGELPDGSTYIVTVPKRGYRFYAPVMQQTSATLPIEIPAALNNGASVTPNGIATDSAQASSPPSSKPPVSPRWMRFLTALFNGTSGKRV